MYSGSQESFVSYWSCVFLKLSGSIGVISIIRVHRSHMAYVRTHMSYTGSQDSYGLYRFMTLDGITGAIGGRMSRIFEIRRFL